jgi:hypothetical protein
MGDKKRRKVISRESSTEWLEKLESSRMGLMDEASSHVRAIDSVSLEMMEECSRAKAKLWWSGELIDLTEGDEEAWGGEGV